MKKNFWFSLSIGGLALVAISCSLASVSPSSPLSTPMPIPSFEPSGSPSAASLSSADAAVALVQAQFPEVAKIQKSAAGAIGASQNIFVFERGDGWDVVFWQGDGDCPAGCINNRYWYFSVKKDGRVSKEGDYVRIFDAQKNIFDISGAQMWGVPK